MTKKRVLEENPFKLPEIEPEKDKHQPETDPSVIIEREFSRYRLPDDAIDLNAWLKDGLAVYNLFQLMKPAFFAMLRANGGKFTFSMKEAEESLLKERIHFSAETIQEPYDHVYTITMEDRSTPAEVNTSYKPIED